MATRLIYTDKRHYTFRGTRLRLISLKDSTKTIVISVNSPHKKGSIKKNKTYDALRFSSVVPLSSKDFDELSSLLILGVECDDEG